MSHKSLDTLAHIRIAYVPLLLDLKILGNNLDCDYNGALVANFMTRPTLIDQIRGKQMQDYDLVREVQKIMNGEIRENFMMTRDEKGKICVPNVDDLRKVIIEKAYCFAYAMHPDSTKMYRTIKKNYWWSSMKRDIAEFISKCLVCQQVKAEH